MNTREQFEKWKRTVPPVHAEEVEKMFRAWQASRAAALEEAADHIDSLNDSAGDRAAYDNREMYQEERERMQAFSFAADAIRALAKDGGE